MSLEWFEYYEKIARKTDNPTLRNGRYIIDQFNEPYLVEDVRRKLDLDEKDTLLDIGCGAAVISFPLSKVVKEVYALDNQAAIEKLQSGVVPQNARLLAGNWLDYDTGKIRNVNKVIIYGVMQCMSDLGELYAFVDKAVNLLACDGHVLLGSIPNEDKKKRFIQSAFGREFDRNYKEQVAQFKEDKLVLSPSVESIVLNDAAYCEIMEHYNGMGCDVYILPRAATLPLSYTRSDILIEKRF